jgi:hypothetical protein
MAFDEHNAMVGNDKTKMRPKNEQYFASKEPKDCASVLLNKASTFFNVWRTNEYIDKMNVSWRFYHGAYADNMSESHRVNFTGEQGELVQLSVNHYSNLAQHMLNMVTSSRPVMESRAVNTDYKSLAQTYLANGILEYYMREKNLEAAIKKACEMSIVLGSGFVKMEWNANGGEIFDVDPDTGEFNREGEIEFYNLSPLDVVVDGSKENWNERDWVLVRTFKNKYDLAAKYPDQAEKITGLAGKTEINTYRLAYFSNDDTDDIPVYEFFHKQSSSLPEGRYLQFLASDVILLDQGLPYREIPVYRITPREILGTPYGYTPMFDIIPLQEMINMAFSTIATNQNSFGVQNVWVSDTSDIAIESLAGGMNVIRSKEKPEGINLTQTPGEIFKYLEILIQSAETVSGVNSVARGNPEASLRSGTALALVQSMALQFMSGLQGSYVKLIEDTGRGLLNILKDFATTPKIVALVGKNNKTLLKEFTGEDISHINRVIVDMGNPLSRSIAGRVQMAEQLAQMKLLKNPQQYFEVMNTGKLEMTYEGEMSQTLLVKAENERLMDGRPVRALATDSHRLHVSEHQAVLADPDLREDESIATSVLDHIQEHIRLLRETDPGILSLCGEEPLPPIQSPGGVPPEGPGQNEALPMENQDVIEQSKMAEMMGPQPQTVSGQTISGPGVTNIKVPEPSKVPASALPNPALQQAAMGNVKQ